MKIAVNARCLLPEHADPLGRFTEGLLNELAINYPEHEFFVFFQKKGNRQFRGQKNINSLVLKPAGKHPLLLHWWYQVSLPKALRLIEADVFLSTDGLTPFKTKVPRLTLVTAAAYTGRAGNFLSQKYLQHSQNKTLRESEKLFAASGIAGRFSALPFTLPEAALPVVPPAANPDFKKINMARQVQVREKFVSNEAYFFLPEVPPKATELKIILEAFWLLKKRTGNDLKLVIAGSKSQKNLPKEIKDINKIFPAAVISTGPVTAHTLASLYGAAVATIYFPAAGSFNLPVLEAQQCECPVICIASGEVTPLPGTIALTVTSEVTENLFGALVAVYHDLEHRAQVIKQGRQNAEKFTWEKSCKQVMQLLEETAKARRNAGSPV